ncbi:helix-turn-helix domain-containing protein, partial [Megamonas hypermegale]|uniref:helix-turn-helix domain-containing protein n=1 Tax=Megamonas hypermegale TaxID=158847 RepID=UPI0019565658
MTKYSNEFKAIKMVLKGDSIYHVAKILNMPNTAPLRRWIFHYENGGISQLLHKNRKYTPIFKQKVIEYKWLHHLSLNQTAAKFSIPNTGTISTWEKLYSSYGFSGLLAKKRGRPSMKKSK